MKSIVDSIKTQDVEAVLEAVMDSGTAGGRRGGPWGLELTPVVKHCGVVLSEPGPVLQVNPTWLLELIARGELDVLADEMRTWHLINAATGTYLSHQRDSAVACPAACPAA